MASQELKHISDQQVADTHEKLLARDGGLPGYRPGARLSSVLDRVRNNILYGGQQYRDASTVAALTTYAIIVGHAFNDANKRTAMAVGLVVLKINGVTEEPDEVSLRELIKSAAAGEVDLQTFTSQYIGLLQPSLSA